MTLKFSLIAVIVAVVGYLVWDRMFSRSGRIESTYRACMNEIGGGADKASADIKSQLPKGSDPASAIAKGMGDAMASMVQGMGGAMCNLIKDTCTKDFDGQICQSARSRYR